MTEGGGGAGTKLWPGRSPCSCVLCSCALPHVPFHLACGVALQAREFGQCGGRFHSRREGAHGAGQG